MMRLKCFSGQASTHARAAQEAGAARMLPLHVYVSAPPLPPSTPPAVRARPFVLRLDRKTWTDQFRSSRVYA